MANREITLWIDDRLAAELEKVLPGRDIQKAMEDKLAELTSQVPAQTLNAICREIDSENEQIAREAEARRRFSAIKVTENGQFFLDHLNDIRTPSVSLAVLRMFHHMSNIFRDTTAQDSTHQALHIDRKRRRELQEKRIAMGHKPDDHEDENMNQNIR